MRTLVILLAMSTALFGGACAYLLWSTGDVRGSLIAESQDEGVAETGIAALVAERDRLQRELQRARRESSCAEPEPTGGRTAAGAAGEPGLAIVRGARPRRERPFDGLSPEQRHTMVRQRFGRLFRELELSDARVHALLPVLARHAEEAWPAIEAFAPLDTPEGREREREIAAVLGAEKAEQFAELRKQMPARSEVQRVRHVLESVGEPVSEGQRSQLVELLKSVRLPDPPALGGASDAPPHEAMERFRSWRSERAKYVRDAAAAVLTPRQLERLDESDALLEAMQAVSVPVP